MKNKLKIILLILINFILYTTLIIGCFHSVKLKRYNETKTIGEIKEESKSYMLDMWLTSGIELKFITQELINEDTLVYYFEVAKPDYFYVYGNRIHYIKAVYKFKNNSWQFDRVMTSSYKEIEPLLENRRC